MPVPKSDHQFVERRSLRQIAIEKIKAAILDHTLQPGEDLKDEELMGWLGMSRTPIREALIELTRIGLVETEAQRFTRVANPDPSTAIFDYQVVGALLGGIVRTTVPALSPTANRKLVAELDRMIAAIEAADMVDYGRRGWELVHALLGYCPNPALVAATNDVLDGKLYRLSLSRLNIDRGWDNLREIYDDLRTAVKAGDAIGAELATERIFQLGEKIPKP
jgi:DNA-binding GntR family transcriptional regulator